MLKPVQHDRNCMFTDKLSLLKKFFLIILFFLFLYFSFRTLQSHIFSIHFVDEDENMIAGHYMAQGKKLYSEIFSHKQPMPAVFSALINKTLKPNSLFLFIKRHREAVFFYSVFWYLVFLIEFGWSGLVFSIAIEISKRFLLGDLFLAESLVIFPLVYVLGCLWRLNWKKYDLSGLRKLLFLFSLILIPFQLFILIPFTAILVFYLFLRERFKKRLFISFFVIFMIFFLVFLPFVSYFDYFFNTKAAIMTHYLKDTINKGLFEQFSLAFLRPFVIAISFPKTEFGLFVWFLSIIYLLSFIYLFFKKRKKRVFLFFTFLLLGFANLRPEQIEATFYGGFHGLPWFSLIILLMTIQIREIISLWNKEKKTFFSFIVVSLAFLTLIYSGNFLIKDYFRKVDRERDFWVNFSQFLGIGRVIKTLSNNGDKLMTIPVEQILYFSSGLTPQNRFLYTYEWIFSNEKLKNELKMDLEKNPPNFVYYDYASVGNEARILFDLTLKNYVQLKNNDTTSNLLVKSDRLDNLEDWQIKGIKTFGFTIPGWEDKKE
ncbi:hypothetical protein ISS85_03105 [Candidatus Microgenomates bacterium]|nr:hypothetical protein [Candidatus Microgenomates bacterium]